MLVSVVIPTYNRAGKVLRAVDSVLHQSFKDFELIVVDDGSTDDTKFWIKNYQDPRLKFFSIPHGGVARARNFGVTKTSGEWICFLDSDDVWRRHKLSEQVHYHEAHRDILISQTNDVWLRNSVRVNKMKKHAVREGPIFRESLQLCLICASSVMIKKSLFDAIGGFDESLPTCEDYDLWLRITAQHSVGFVAKPLVTKFGGHADQLSKAFPAMDQYRVLALKKLITSANLSESQLQWTKEALTEKLNILQTHSSRTIKSGSMRLRSIRDSCGAKSLPSSAFIAR